MKNKKNALLGASLLGACLLIVINYTEYAVLFRDVLGRQYLEMISNFLVFFPSVLFFVLLTYKMPDRVFRSWWEYAKIAIPVTFITSLLISLDVFHSGTPGGNGWLPSLDQVINLFFIILTIFLFTLGSLIQIYRGYIRSHGGLVKLFGSLLLLGIAIPVLLMLILKM